MIFLDTNILLEVVLTDRPHFKEVERFVAKISEETAVSLLTVHLVMYFGRKEQANDAFLHAVLNENKLIPLTQEDYEWATDNENGNDFEDALQIAAAVRSGCTTFVTLDKQLAKRYTGLPIKIVIPE